MTHRDTKRYNGMIPGDTPSNQMRDYLMSNMGFDKRDAIDAAKALHTSVLGLVFVPNDTIAFELKHLRPELTAKILEFLTKTYNNRGPDGKHIVSELFWVDEGKTILCQR